MEKINLKPNHQRSVSSSIRLVENMVDEIERQVLHPSGLLLTRIDHADFAKDIEHIKSVTGEIRNYILYLFEKYNLKPSELKLNRIVNARKSSMWTILCDTTSGKLKGYGDFPEEYTEEFDSDIDRLQQLISKI